MVPALGLTTALGRANTTPGLPLVLLPDSRAVRNGLLLLLGEELEGLPALLEGLPVLLEGLPVPRLGV